MSEYFDALCAPELKLRPLDDAQKRRVKRDWADFKSNAGARNSALRLLPQAVVNEMRAHPAGAFALRIYEEQRHRVGSKVA